MKELKRNHGLHRVFFSEPYQLKVLLVIREHQQPKYPEFAFPSCAAPLRSFYESAHAFGAQDCLDFAPFLQNRNGLEIGAECPAGRLL
jgi:hypothetical protein